jgi:Ca-activated chloride channel family protein
MRRRSVYTAAGALLVLVLTAGRAFGDGFIVVPRPPVHPVSVAPGPFPLEVKYHHVKVAIRDRTAVTSIDQVFYNPHNQNLEGEYIFPVPKGAVINNFSMDIDGKEMRAELLDAAKARRIYEEIVRQIRDPALLEYQGTNIFRLRIFPIEAHKEKRIRISYSEILGREGSRIEYVYPLNTEKFSAAPLQSVSVAVSIESSEKIKNIFSTTHTVDTIFKGDRRATAGWEAEHVKPDTDFKLYYTQDKADFGVSLLAHRVAGDDGFFFLDLSPGYWAENRTHVPKDVVFVLDVSGSMAGDKLAKAKSALVRCLERLDPRDRFGVIRFSTEAEAFTDTLLNADKPSLQRAVEYVNKLLAVGGTNIEDALAQALRLGGAGTADDSRARMIVFITDGKPTIGETDSDRLVAGLTRANRGHLRIFTVGIDTSLDTILLDKITTATRAYRTYVTPQEDIEAKIAAFYQKLDAPVLANLALSVSGGVKLSAVQPSLTDLPDLFQGSSLTLLGRYRGDGTATLTLKGSAAGRPVEYAYELSFPAANADYENIAPLWASRRIGYLLEQMRLAGESKEVIDEVTSLARTYGIITPYTSYLVLEDERRRVTRRELPERDQTLRNMAPPASEFYSKSRSGYDEMKEESGAGGVRASNEVQELRLAQANDAARKSAPRLNYKDASGRTVDVQTQIKQVRGRAFYNSGKEWNDSAIQNQRPRRTNRVQFGSDAYWRLVKDKPATGEFLSLGANVRFMLDGDLYEIYE